MSDATKFKLAILAMYAVFLVFIAVVHYRKMSKPIHVIHISPSPAPANDNGGSNVG